MIRSILLCSLLMINLPSKAQSKEKVAESINKFGFDLLKQVDNNENFAFSPLSISTAIAMTNIGAAASTREKINDVFHFPANEAFYSGYQTLNEEILIKEVKNTKINLANSIWVQANYTLTDDFLKQLKHLFNTGIHQADFMHNTEKARSDINNWVSEKTFEKIPELIPQGSLNQLSRLVLVNALYFKSVWQQQFEEAATKKRPFYRSKNNQLNVDFMSQNLNTKVFVNKEIIALELPYENEKYTFQVIMPRNGKKEKKFRRKFNEDYVNAIEKKMKEEQIHLFLPKFTLRKNYSLQNELSKMGMKIAFTDKADFSRMTGDQSLKIDDVVHESFVSLDEKGTEAAAATAVIMRMKSAFKPKANMEVNINQPFYFFIREKNSKLILFMGKVNEPKSN